MAKYYQDFVGLNTFIYEASGWEIDEQSSELGTAGQSFVLQQNQILTTVTPNIVTGVDDLINIKNSLFPYLLPNTASYFNAVIVKRNGPYGYPIWKQVRVSDNPLSRKQRKENIFTFVQEPGRKFQTQINGKFYDRLDRYGDIIVTREPVIQGNHMPLELFAGIETYSQALNKSVERKVLLKTSFGNEIVFFANDQINRNYETELITDANYEDLKALYLDGGLEDDGSPLNSFKLLRYRQSVWPRPERSYLNKTRSRTFFVNKFWRDVRTDRKLTGLNANNGFGTFVPRQSMWPLDVAEDWATRDAPVDALILGTDTFLYYIGGVSGSVSNLGGYNTGEDTENVVQTNPSSLGGAGILMNSYSHLARGFFFSSTQVPTYTLTSIDGFQPELSLSASAYYSKRHTLNSIQSVVSRAGMEISETGSLTGIATGSLYEGLAAWDAPSQAGKNPFYDSYEKYGENIRLKGKGYSIVPEFRISSHVETYQSKGVTEELTSIFELSGATKENDTTANNDSFYTVLSNSDFLKHFELIKKDHKDFANPISLVLRCKAVKKFLPYKGFYPADRTTEIAQQFYSSYSDFVQLYQGDKISSDAPFAFQTAVEPLFAPGVLFNTIKAGVACDYPMLFRGFGDRVSVDFEGAGSTDKVNTLWEKSDLMSDELHNSAFNKRIAFDALIEPEKYLANEELKIQEPNAFGLGQVLPELSSVWDGTGDNLYKKMMNNFLAEVPEFFIKDQNFTTITSLESQNPEFGNAVSGNYYVMRVKMYHSRDKGNARIPGMNDTDYQPPQDLYEVNGVSESFTMYSRPTAFGAPTFGTTGSGSIGSITISGSDSLHGYNFPFTPPYYHGEAWCDVIFKPSESRKYSLDEILREVREYPYFTRYAYEPDAIRDLIGGVGTSYTGSYEKYSASPWKELIIDEPNHLVIASARADNEWSQASLTGSNITIKTAPSDPAIQHPYYLNYNAMQLDSSVNLFSKGEIKTVNLSGDGLDQAVDVATEVTSERKARWIIQPKFETPMLNFNSYTDLSADGLTEPQFAGEQTPRGMWHQYGILEEDASKGVFLQVTDVPNSWMAGALGVGQIIQSEKVRSLADLCGFSKEPVRLGQVAEVKEISEAVVAVPFIEQDGTRKFFSIPRRDIEESLDGIRREVEPGVFVAGGEPKVGKSTLNMVRNMQKYVFPPSMDFVTYKEIDPFAMYVFEFKHNLTKQDLADMWQNLPPSIGRSFEESETVIGHPLLAQELLGGGAVINEDGLDKNAKGDEVPTNIQWMIFKAKKRAKTNYYDKVVGKKGTTADTSTDTLQNTSNSQIGETGDITYNWPYDFFSLVELVKLDAEVGFSNVEPDEQNKPRIISKFRDQERATREGNPRGVKARNALGGIKTGNNSGGNNGGGTGGGRGR
jgi:hypothetical protein